MSRNLFVDPDVSKYDLPDDFSEFWVEFKNRLNYGETQKLASAGMSGIKAETTNGQVSVDSEDTQLLIDNEKFQVEKLYIYLADWNFTGPKGKSIPINRDTIRRLDADVGTLVDELLVKHMTAMDELKKTGILNKDTTP